MAARAPGSALSADPEPGAPPAPAPPSLDYEAVRAGVRARVAHDWGTPGLRLAGIDEAALATAATWVRDERIVHWDWARLIEPRRGPALDLAIWHEATLCGLAFGEPGEGWLELGYVEARPRPHPLAGGIADIVFAVLETQAALLGIPETRVRRPFGDLYPRYMRRGYRRVAIEAGTIYLCKP